MKLEGKTVYHSVYNDILDQILTGTLLPGDQLPSLTELARRYQVGDSTVRKSLQLLKENGYIRTVHRVGIFVSERTKINATLRLNKEIDKRVNRTELLLIEVEKESEYFKDLAPNEKVLRFERLSYAGVIPAVYCITHLLLTDTDMVDTLTEEKLEELQLEGMRDAKDKLIIELSENSQAKQRLLLTPRVGMMRLEKAYYSPEQKLTCVAETYFPFRENIEINCEIFG